MTEAEAPESEPTASPADADEARPRSWFLAHVLLGVTTMLGIVAVLTVGARSQVLDTDE